MKKEFTILKATPADTQKKIRQWVSAGYDIEIVAQHAGRDQRTGNILWLLTSLWRTK